LSSRGIRCSLRVFCPSKYCAYGLRIPVLLLALASALRFFLAGVYGLLFKQSVSSSRRVSRSSRVLFSQPSRPASTGRLLSWAFAPFSTCRHRRSTSCECAALTTVPPSGFGYPLDGLLPSIPGRPCFRSTALMGFTLRSHPSVGSFARCHVNRPAYRFSCRYSRCYDRVGPAGRGSRVRPGGSSFRRARV
jgi:hypothetical protein